MTAQRIVVGVGGGIAAYKVCEVVSTLAKSGGQVRTVLTQSAQEFVTPLTFATLSRHPAYSDRDFWSAQHGRPLHIELGEWADLLVLAPLTANTLSKLVHGFADNLLTNTVLASTCPILVAPAMNTDMWEQAPVQENWQRLQRLPRYHAVSPGSGILACDRVGAGRMAEPSDILAAIHSLLYTHGKRDLAGKHLLISTGGTREFLDPVRFIGNPSTGKMGVALAQAAHHRGAIVTLVHAPLVGVTVPPDIPAIAVTSAAEMHQALLTAQPHADWIIMAAAVADVQPAITSPVKLPKSELPAHLPLQPVPDLVADLASRKLPHQRLIGFAAQTGDILTPAKEKLQRKGLDAIAANAIDQPQQGFGSDTNQAIFLDRSGRQVAMPHPVSKLQMAHELLDFIHGI